MPTRGGTSLGLGSKAGAEFWLAVNKPSAQGSKSIIFRKAQRRLKLEFGPDHLLLKVSNLKFDFDVSVESVQG